MDLSTTYLGMQLDSPLVPSASPLARSLDIARELEDAGAAALVMYSLFEEELNALDDNPEHFLYDQTLGHAEATSFIPVHGEVDNVLERYLEQLRRLKEALDIPVIASLNGVTQAGWVEHGKLLEEAGADALELNIYYVAADIDESGARVEQRYLDLLAELRRHIRLPIMVKLSPQFSSVGHMVKRLEEAGADGVSLFNRFYQPDIDIDSLQVAQTLHLSRSDDALLAMRWIGILHGRVGLTLAATGGIHTAEDAIKMVLAGADVTHLCATLLKHGPQQLARIRQGMQQWLEESAFDSLDQARGLASQQHVSDPSAFARANYVQLLSLYNSQPNADWR